MSGGCASFGIGAASPGTPVVVHAAQLAEWEGDGAVGAAGYGKDLADLVDVVDRFMVRPRPERAWADLSFADVAAREHA
jgi:hypothetical protein